MLKQLVTSAILAILLVHYISSTPLPSSKEDDVATNEIEHGNQNYTVELSGHQFLTNLALENYSLFLNFQLLHTRQIAKDILADPSVYNVDTVEMQSRREILKEYVVKAKNASEIQLPPGRTDHISRFFLNFGKETILENFQGFARSINESHTTDPSDAQKIIWQALLRHGWKEFQIESDRRMEDFVVKFADDVVLYLNSLSQAERLKESELVSIYESYQNENEKEAIPKVKLGQVFYLTLIKPH